MAAKVCSELDSFDELGLATASEAIPACVATCTRTAVEASAAEPEDSPDVANPPY